MIATPPPDFVTGDGTGIAIPAHPEAMREGAARFLTEAMHAYGTLDPGNRVADVTQFEPFAGGNSGRKLALSVRYARDEPNLPNALFAKFSRDFDDPFRDRRRHELDAEIHIAELSRLPAFPVPVARAVFADSHGESGTGLLITERIAFGAGAIEPLHPKCMDHRLPDAWPYYAATVSAQARLAAAHKAGRLSPQVEQLFPFDPEAAAADMPFAGDSAALAEKVERWDHFAQTHPQLLPPGLGDAAFFARLAKDVAAFVRHEAALRRFLHADPRFIALTHWNTNLDNAWFWREADGALRCGLLDWGMARQMNIGFGLWGGLSAADPGFLATRLEDLFTLYARELVQGGGPAVTADEVALHFDLSVALLGLSLMMDTPALVEARMPGLAQASDLHDPRILAEPVVQGFLQVSLNFLELWRTRRFGSALATALGA